MTSSERCVAELKQQEGFTPVAKHLPGDRPGVITGAYGDTDVKLGQTFTEEQASERLRKRLATEFEPIVNRAVKVPLQQSQFDALVLFLYNVGAGDPNHKPKPIEGLLTSTLLRKLNAGDIAGAADEFPRWNKADGKVLGGLVKRRKLEQTWFLESAMPEKAP
jgi:lysozyme